MSKILPAIDHVVIGVNSQLDAAANRYRELGFELLERGHHTLGTSNHLAIFGDDYLELLGYEPPQAQAQASNPMWRHPAGLLGLVFKPDNVHALGERLRAQGLTVEQPRAFSRPVQLPDGQFADARFETLHLPPETTAGGVVFFCQHHTPQHVWRKEWRQHPNGVTGIREFIIGATNPAASVQPFTKVFDTAVVTTVPGGLRLSAGRGDVLFLEPQTIVRRFGIGGAAAVQGEDRFAGLVFQTKDLSALRSLLQAASIPEVLERDATLIVPAAQAFGVTLAFTEGK